MPITDHAGISITYDQRIHKKKADIIEAHIKYGLRGISQQRQLGYSYRGNPRRRSPDERG